MAKKTFCDGCDEEITFDDNGNAMREARVNLSIRATCKTLGEQELGQFAQDGLDLCRSCINRMRTSMDPKHWVRVCEMPGPRQP